MTGKKRLKLWQLYFMELNSLLYGIKLFTTQSCLLKTSLEKENMLVTSIFSFSHNVFYTSKNTF